MALVTVMPCCCAVATMTPISPRAATIPATSATFNVLFIHDPLPLFCLTPFVTAGRTKSLPCRASGTKGAFSPILAIN